MSSHVQPNGQKLARFETRQCGAVHRLQIERARRRRFFAHLDHLQLTPRVCSRNDRFGLRFPATRLRELRGVLHRRPAKRQHARRAPHLADMKTHEALGRLVRRNFRAFPDDLGIYGEVQQIAAFEVDREQSRARILKQVTNRIEEQIAAEIRHRQRVRIIDADKAGLAATMRDIGTARQTGLAGSIGGGDKKRVRTRQQRTVGVTEFGGQLRRDGLFLRRGDKTRRAALNIFGAVAEALTDAERERVLIDRTDHAVDTIAPTRSRLNTKPADQRTDLPRRRQRIARQRTRGDAHSPFIRSRNETRFADPQRGPWLTARIESAQHHERLFREKRAMLLGHIVADSAACVDVHAFPHADPLLRCEFTHVKRRLRGAPARRGNANWGRRRSGGGSRHDDLDGQSALAGVARLHEL